MEIKAIAGDITTTKADAVIVSCFEGTENPKDELLGLDKALDGVISQLISQGEVKGKLNEVTIIHSLGKLPASRVAITGLGKPAELSPDRIRGAIAETCRRLRQRGVKTIATTALGSGTNSLTTEDAAQAITEGALLGLYTFRKHITRKDNDYSEIEQLLIIATNEAKPSLEIGIGKGKILAEATNLARDMVNEPANYMTPDNMAEAAMKLAKSHGLEISILEREQMQELGMGALLGVAQGSEQPPKLIVLSYKGTDAAGIDLALVGKGITFDSGGISIKPSDKMDEMKGDMAGGASVMAAISAIARLKLAINVMAIVPATENLPSGKALKPGDVLTAMNGKTIEVLNTDAEGRLILADALAYAGKLGAGSIVDVATLTGACMVALGRVCSGVFGNNQKLTDKAIAAGAEAGELIWQLPMYAEYNELIKGDVADIKNTGGRYGGAITAAKFLAEFVDETPWIHLDIAGTSMSEKERIYQVKGATGVPVRTLVNLAIALTEDSLC